MSTIISEWDNAEKTVWRVETNPGWTWTQFTQAIDEAYAVIGQLDYRVDFVMYFKASLPPGDAIGHLTHAGGTQPTNIYRTVMVNNSTRFLDIIVKNADRKEGWEGPDFFTTMEEAREFLRDDN